ncbi:MAG: glutamate--tRNA ligase [Bacillota bacterium]|nr:glutamate--tRNA ligase [Bacillota bacterium]
MENVRVRFAPSPTGYLHIGGLRTALYNYLFAKKHGGKFVLRIEDTDQTRFVDGAIENLIRSLHWAGIDYDEGVVIDENGKVSQKGDFGPYIQSQRLDLYRKYVDELIEKGYAYYCFCGKERLDDLREMQKAQGKIPKYDGLCRGVSLEDAKKRIAAGEEHVVRLKMPKNKNLEFDDLVRGHISINSDDVDDQVLLKSDGYPTYHLAVVVDDHLMGISHIVRGEEWISSTPKHVYLYEAFGWEKPTFVHLPTVLNDQRKKLSKREGDVSVEDFKKSGYLAPGLVNYLALVGWSPEDNKEILSLKEMEEMFDFDRVSNAGGIFDRNKLDWVNAHYMKELSGQDLYELAQPYIIEAGLVDEETYKAKKDWMIFLLQTVQGSVSTLKEIPQAISFAFEDLGDLGPEEKEILQGQTVPQLLQALEEKVSAIEDFNFDQAKGLMKSIQKETGIKGKNLYMPTRIVLTGLQHGPELANILYLFGKDKILERIRKFK